MIVNRSTYIDQLIRSKGNGLIKIITGLRRSGKSFLLKKLFRQHLLDDGVKEDHIIIIDMESRKNKPFKDPDYLLDWVEKEMKDDETYYIIIDEVQEVNDFVEVLSTLSVTEGTDVYVTGSNSRFLSSDVVTEFRGRGDEIHVWPLSFKEFMSVFPGSKEDAWSEYIMFGGLPQLLTQIGDDKKSDFLRRLYRTVYLRDIYERNDITLKPEFEELSKTVASSIGAPVNALNIANTFKSVSNVQNITDKTVSVYLEYMQDAFLIEKSERYNIKGRKYIGSLSFLSDKQSQPTSWRMSSIMKCVCVVGSLMLATLLKGLETIRDKISVSHLKLISSAIKVVNAFIYNRLGECLMPTKWSRRNVPCA